MWFAEAGKKAACRSFRHVPASAPSLAGAHSFLHAMIWRPAPACRDLQVAYVLPDSRGGVRMADLVLLDIDRRGVATATLNRPEVGNAYNEAMLGALAEGLV